MRPSGLRRLVILAEGQFAPHSAKTAYGVIRYGRDDVVAVLDSSRAGQNVSAYLPGRDIPIVATLDDSLALPNPPDALLIGIAPTGGRLPDAWRSTILAAIDAGLDVLSGLHMFLGDDPGVRRGRGRSRDRRSSTTGDHRTGWKPPSGRKPRTGQAGDPDGRDGLRHRQDVGRAGAAQVGAGRRRPGVVRADRPDRDDDRRLGRRGRPRHQRLRPGHRRVAGRAGRGARRLGPGRGPGLARPPGLFVGDAGTDPRRHAAGHGHDPQARPGRARLRSPARGVLPDRVAARVHRPARAGRRARRAVEGRRGRAQHLALSGRRRGPADHRGDRGRDRPAGRRPGPVRRRPAVAGHPRSRRRASLGRPE